MMQISIEIEREMAISRNEFLRILPLAVLPGSRIDLDSIAVFIVETGQTVRIEIREGADVEIASLRLPRLHIRLGFESAAAFPDFMRRFDRAFQRGGG